MTRKKLTAIALPSAVLILLAAASSGLGAGDSATTAATPKSGVYKGKTRQGERISFRVRKGRSVRKLKFRWEADCSGGTSSGSTSIVKVAIKNGRFKYDGGGTTVSGRFTTPTKAKGKLRVETRTFGPFAVECDSGTVRWSARRK